MPATAVILPPGEVLGGFRIGEVVGIGGMAVVYRARQLSLNREVALKVLSPELGSDEAFSERFRREGIHVAQLDHPHIISIYDAGEADGRLFLAMRLVVGMTLAERIRIQPLSAGETLHILGPVAEGLDAAHAIGLVHRDIKPQNILLADGDHPYLADFGVAKGAESAVLTVEGGFVGTFNYAAPEQVLGNVTVPTTDVYALTAVLYQCLTGTVPYPRDTEAGLLYTHVNKPPPQLPLAAAREFNRVIARGMAKDASGRYSTAGELIAAAERSLQGLPSRYWSQRPAFSSTPETPTWASEGAEEEIEHVREKRRNRTAASAAGLAALPEADGSSLNRDLVAGDSSSRPARFGRRRLASFAAAVAIIAGAVAGLLLNGGAVAASKRVVQSDALAISYGRPWTGTSAAIGAFAFIPKGGPHAAAPIQLASGLVTLAAGSLARSAAIPGGPPPALVSRFGRRAARSTSRLLTGEAVAVYGWTVSSVQTVNAWVIPTVRGDLAIICSAPVELASALRSCSAMARGADVDGISLLPPGPDVKLRDAMRPVISQVAASRSTLSRIYQHARPAAVAAGIARADTRAATALGRLYVPERYKSKVSGLAVSLRREGLAVAALAKAAAKHERHASSVGATQVLKASGKVEVLGQWLRRATLLSITLPALHVPSLPRPRPKVLPSPTPVVPTPAPSGTQTQPQTTGTTQAQPQPQPQPQAQPYNPLTAKSAVSSSGGIHVSGALH